MELVIVSGCSGSGKSMALHCLEDLGYYCVDNLPLTLVQSLITKLTADNNKVDLLAIGIDARNLNNEAEDFAQFLALLESKGICYKILFLEASNAVLLRRYNETQRKHPLASSKVSLSAAIKKEKEILFPLEKHTLITINTSNLSRQDLWGKIKSYICHTKSSSMIVRLASFGFKYGAPTDADFIFDVRCLPNPHWISTLKNLTGCDKPVQQFLSQQHSVQHMIDDISLFMKSWLPRFEKTNRSYLTIAIGCTGGQHRSVYICEQLLPRLQPATSGDITICHLQLL